MSKIIKFSIPIFIIFFGIILQVIHIPIIRIISGMLLALIFPGYFFTEILKISNENNDAKFRKTLLILPVSLLLSGTIILIVSYFIGYSYEITSINHWSYPILPELKCATAAFAAVAEAGLVPSSISKRMIYFMN